MLAGLVVFVALGVIVVGPLLWRLRQDRRVERALAVRADVHAALFRALGGDSLVAIAVEPPSTWRVGRVVLSAPADWHRLLAPHWRAVAARVPPGWELVVRPAVAVAAPRGEDLALPRAA